MTDIEDVVRRALRERVSSQPALTEPAERAIAGAAALRRQHTVLAVSAVVVALVAVVSGGVVLRGLGTRPGLPPATGAPVPSTSPSQSASPSPSPTPTLPSVGLSALVESQTFLLTPQGKLLSLSMLPGPPTGAYQTADGWLLNTNFTGTDGGQLWLLRPDGSAQRLLDGVGGYGVVTPDGRRLAWRAGDKLNVGHLDSTGAVITDATTQAPERGDPLIYTGSAVLLGYTATGGGIDNFDVWTPQQGRYTPSWDRAQSGGIVGVWGATPDGRWLIGTALATPGTGSKDTCLARIDPLNRLRVVARACRLPAPRDVGTVSPDGHWLAYQSLDEATGRAQTTVVDLTTVFQQQKVAGTWPGDYPGPWIGPDTVIEQDSNKSFYRYRVGRPTGEEVTVPGAPYGQKIILLPKLS